MQRVAAVVPALNPDRRFPEVLNGLADAGFERIYVVDDGSGEEYRPLFACAETIPSCVVLRHPENRGKGRALKTAFQFHLQNPCGCEGLVTLDADGQHTTQDILAVAAALRQNPHSLVLGARNFSAPGVPPKSQAGNRITRWVFRHMLGLPVTDTQTGLRGISNAFARQLLNVAGERYEFETNMLLQAKQAGVRIMEVPIAAVYFNANAGSHFHPIQDSLRVYSFLLKFLLSSLGAALADYVLFLLLHETILTSLTAGLRLILANSGARLCSALLNFSLNKTAVFQSRGNTGGALLRYAALAAAQLCASTAGIRFVSLLLPVAVAKVLVDTTLFLLSFAVQRRWVFRQ